MIGLGGVGSKLDGTAHNARRLGAITRQITGELRHPVREYRVRCLGRSVAQAVLVYRDPLDVNVARCADPICVEGALAVSSW